MFRQNPFALALKALKRGAYTLRTGYWHTPERCCPDFPDEIFINAFKVYQFALQFCREKRVLDVGCGTGYGASFLAGSASSVVGIDVSRQAIRYARKRYNRHNLAFLRMNAESLRFADRTFDFILSSENFEHLSNQGANLQEMSRILKDDGTLLLATPNREMFLGIDNPYHTHECTYEELIQIVQEFFREWLICDNLLEPPTEEGRHMKEDRTRRGKRGADFRSDPFLWGEPIDTTWLSNTHSFFCFARDPYRSR
jgi:SAM-dependent methyltransferase